LAETGEQREEISYVHPPAEDQAADYARKTARNHRPSPTELRLTGSVTLASPAANRHTHGQSQAYQISDKFRKAVARVTQHCLGTAEPAQ